MIINSENLNVLSDTANLGLIISLLRYSKKGYEMNKESFNRDKDNNEKICKILSEILKELKEVNSKMKGVE